MGDAPFQFHVVSYTGTNSLRFSMTQDEVRELLGPPTRISSNWRKDISFDYAEQDLVVGFNTEMGGVDHIGFGPKARLFWEGVDLFNDPDAYRRLLEADGNPYKYVGFVILLALGLQLEGFERESEYGRSVAMFTKEKGERMKGKLVPFRTGGM